MRFVAVLVALFVFAPAARAQVTFTDVPADPSPTFTFNVGFSAPDAARYDCVHVFPDLSTEEFRDCRSPFVFREAGNGRHVLRVTATDAMDVASEGSLVINV